MDDNRIGDQAKSSLAAATEMGGDLADKARNAAAQAGSAIQDAAAQAAKQVADAATIRAQTAADYVSKQGAQAADYVTKQGAQAAGYVSRTTAEQPWTALLMAGAVGYVIAYLIHGR